MNPAAHKMTAIRFLLLIISQNYLVIIIIYNYNVPHTALVTFRREKCIHAHDKAGNIMSLFVNITDFRDIIKT